MALVAIVLLAGIPDVIGFWLPALGRGPTQEPEAAA
jgi:hypothetical protein